MYRRDFLATELDQVLLEQDVDSAYPVEDMTSAGDALVLDVVDLDVVTTVILGGKGRRIDGTEQVTVAFAILIHLSDAHTAGHLEFVVAASEANV